MNITVKLKIRIVDLFCDGFTISDLSRSLDLPLDKIENILRDKLKEPPLYISNCKEEEKNG